MSGIRIDPDQVDIATDRTIELTKAFWFVDKSIGFRLVIVVIYIWCALKP